MKYFILSGEASGDLHGSNLVKHLIEKDKNAEFEYWGGDLMAEVIGKPPLKHIKDLAFMGFWEVIKHLRTIFKNIRTCKEQIQNYQPDVVILIDYPGFNLRMAKFVKSLGIKVFYYISPTVWAWKESRVKTIQKFVDEMFVILPFEKPFYDKHHYPVHYLGHPLLDAIEQYHKTKQPSLEDFKQEHSLDERPIVALLPGSREQEVRTKLPIMLGVVDTFKEYQFVVSVAPTLDKVLLEDICSGKDVRFVVNKTYDLLSHAHSALVTSGTATLETALFKVPQVVCYLTSKLSFSIAKRIVDVKYISLVNLILDKKVVTELLQNDLNVQNVEQELKLILEGAPRQQMLQFYDELEHVLGGAGASERIANEMIKQLSA